MIIRLESCRIFMREFRTGSLLSHLLQLQATAEATAERAPAI